MKHPDYPENIVKRGWRVLRRAFLIKFRRKYVDESINQRQGICLQCGECCKTSGCKEYDEENNICRIWKYGGKDKMPLDCQLFPFDEKDQIPYCKVNCGYHWGRK